MKHDESALVKQALRDAREQLARTGRVCPGAYMLVRLNPQTGAPLTHETALGSQRDAPFASQAEYLAFVDTLRTEARRLQAIAVVIAGEAQAEVETTQGAQMRRVLYVRVEDHEGIHQLHASIDANALGTLLADPDTADELELPILPR
ncbi:MAG TPA: hypothetical protein VHZ95_03310 [Polyangiales bacterium]|nr:hypothetical protein [Polyangiales bacterium]